VKDNANNDDEMIIQKIERFGSDKGSNLSNQSTTDVDLNVDLRDERHIHDPPWL
jgi:hypothetical protein